MEELAKNVVERSIAVPGVQAKLSMSLVKGAKVKSKIHMIDMKWEHFVQLGEGLGFTKKCLKKDIAN